MGIAPIKVHYYYYYETTNKKQLNRMCTQLCEECECTHSTLTEMSTTTTHTQTHMREVFHIPNVYFISAWLSIIQTAKKADSWKKKNGTCKLLEKAFTDSVDAFSVATVGSFALQNTLAVTLRWHPHSDTPLRNTTQWCTSNNLHTMLTPTQWHTSNNAQSHFHCFSDTHTVTHQ